MNSLQISINNSLVSKDKPRDDHKPTIFNRILRLLIENGRHPGKTFPIYVEIEGNYKVLGAFTFNTGGSVSFFPDLFGDLPFDHITLDKNFTSRGGHLTAVDKNKNKKVFTFDGEKLEDGDHHVITFMMTGGNMLMDLFPKIEMPSINFEENREKEYLSMLQEALQNSTGIIQFPEDTTGVYCIQILLESKRRKENEIKIYTKPISDFLTDLQDLEKPIMTKKLEIFDDKNPKLSFYVSAFRVKGKMEMNSPMIFAVNNGKFLRDVPITIFKKRKS